MKKYVIILIYYATSMLLLGCGGNENAGRSVLDEGDELETVSRAPISEIEAEQIKSAVLEKARRVVAAIDGRNMADLSEYVHPVQGLRISPYPNIDVDEHLVFTARETARLMEVDTAFTWGREHASGEPITLTPAAFFDQYLYDKDYLNPDQIGYDEVIRGGTMPHNYRNIYELGHLVDYHVVGDDPRYDGMDWGSLLMVFTPYQGEWYLQSISHGEWTI